MNAMTDTFWLEDEGLRSMKGEDVNVRTAEGWFYYAGTIVTVTDEEIVLTRRAESLDDHNAVITLARCLTGYYIERSF